MSRSTAQEFKDDQRAEIYARDRALCAYSGRSLWLADYGAAPHAVDWIDHVLPVARGGLSTIDNGVACSHLYNFQKRAGAGSVLLFRAGRPTSDFFTFFHVVPPSIAEHLVRFAELAPADWFFNRALLHVLLGAVAKSAKRKDGTDLARGADYRARAAFRFLETWSKKSAGLPSLRKRGLLPKRPGPDQKLLLSAAHADSESDLKRLIGGLAPYSAPSWRALEMLADLNSNTEARAFARAVAKHPHVASSVKRAVQLNVKSLSFGAA